jgi:nucleoside-diphosphate-sugar epimerase
LSVRVLVTGAAGFIGSHLCRRLVAEGHDVVGFDDLSEGSLANLVDVPEVRFIQGDLRESEAVSKALVGCHVVLHHGAMRSVQLSVVEPQRFTDVNVLGTLNVLVAARNELASVVFSSSSSIYGNRKRYPLTEDMEPRPRSPYAATKVAGEAYCRAWFESFGVPTVSLRYFNVYGPGQNPGSQYAAVIPRFVTACLAGSDPVIYGDGQQARDFTYIDDIVAANVLAAGMPKRARGQMMNIGGGRSPTSVNELLSMIARLTGTTPRPVRMPPQEGDIRRSEADISLARRLIGYDPGVPIQEGLRRTVEWFRTFNSEQRATPDGT